MPKPALKCENNAIFKQTYSQKLLFPVFAVLALGEI